MRKNLLHYIAAIVAVATVLFLFNREYRGLTAFAELSNRHNQVYNTFQNLRIQINNAAVVNPNLLKATNSQKNKQLFATDSAAIIAQIRDLQTAVRDTVNVKIANELYKAVPSELSWLLSSNVPDSIINHKAPGHVAALHHIDSLISQGILRTGLLIEERKQQLKAETGTLKLAITVFILLSALLFTYITFNLFKQQSKRRNKEKELETVFNRINDSVVSVDNKWRYTFLNDIALSTHPLGKNETLGKSIWDVHPEMKDTVFWDIYQEAMETRQVLEVEDYYAPMDTWFSVKVYPSANGLTIFYKDVTKAKKAELGLLQSLQEVSDYKFALDESSIVAITDHRGIINYVNDNFCKISKYSNHELIGKDHRIINSGYHSKKFIKDLWATIAKGKIWKGEIKNKAKDGSTYWVDTTIVPFLNDMGKPYQYVAIRSDITERKRLEEKQALFVSIVNSSHDAILSKTLGGVITSWNKGAQKIFGYTAEEIIGQHIATLIPTFYWSQEYEIMEKIRAGQVIDHYETERVTKDGTILHVSLTISPLKDDQGNIIGASKIVRDISRQKQAEEEITQLNTSLERKVLERTNELMKAKDKLAEILDKASFSATIANSIQDPIISSDDHGIITRWNKAAELLLEWKAEEVVGRLGTDMLKIDYLDQKREIIYASLEEKKFWQGEVIYHTKSGLPVHVLITASKLKDGEGRIIGNLALVRDITKRKQAEEKLKEFEHFFNNSNDFNCIANTNGYFEIVNASFYQVLGYSQNELSARPFIDFVHPEDVKATMEAYLQLKQGATVVHFINRYRKADGCYVWFDWNATPNVESGKLYCIARDITDRKKAEDALTKLNEELEQKVKDRTKEISKNANRFRALLENNNDVISLMNEQFQVIYRSPSASRITGWQDEELLNEDGTKYIHPDDREKAGAIVKELMANPGKNINTVFRNRHRDGHYLWVEGTVTNLLQDENVQAIVFNYRDVTERIDAEYKLAASEIRFRLLIENSTDGIDMSDEFSNNIYRSPGAVKITGVLPKENQIGLTHPDDLEIVKSKQEEMIKNPGIPVPFQARFRHAQGHYLWIEGTLTNLLHVEGVHAFVTNFRDITQRKELEVLLHKANTLARIGGWEVDLVKGTAFWSDITREIHETAKDYVPDLATGISFYKAGPGRDLITQRVAEAIELGTPWDVELQIITAKNNERWIRSIGETEFADGKCIRLYGSFQDITERKKDEIERERLNDRLQLASQSAQLGLWDWDVKKNELIWDEGMYWLYNLTENEFSSVYEGWASRVHPDDRQRVDNDIQLALAGKKEYKPEFRIIWTDSSVHYIKASGVIEKDDEGNLIRMTGFNWDVTEQKEAEQAIIASEEKFRQTFERISDGFVAVDKNWCYTYINKRAAEITRQDPQLILGKNLWDQFPDVTGSLFYKAYQKAMQEQVYMYLEEYYPAYDQWFENHIYPSPEGLSVYFTDITERKKAEEKIKNINIELEQKVAIRTEELKKTNEELEAFSYSVSHDLRAPLRGIIGFTNILEEDYSSRLDAEAMRITGVIKNNTIKMGNLIDDLLSFSRLGRQPIAKTNVHTGDMIAAIIADTGIIKNNQTKWIIPLLPDMQADPNTIKQVWTNLLSNAVKYSAKNQRPVVEIGSMTSEHETVFFVKDNGLGFDMKYKDKLFKVFQRLHSANEFEGTGVGLAIVEKIITKHGGRVWADAEPGKGASFYFSLPNAVTE